MLVFGANITLQTTDLFKTKINPLPFFELANAELLKAFGIIDFFDNQDEYQDFKNAIAEINVVLSEPDRTEYGDFQTNSNLAYALTKSLKNKDIQPKFLIEPTSGKGNFIIAALDTFPTLEKIIGVEIYKPYTWQVKFNILDYYISNPRENKPQIEIRHANVFDFDFDVIAQQLNNKEVLVLGNPPWVTNAQLGGLGSDNLPQKSNFKKHTGLEAITGKGNFDIAEYITLILFDAFQSCNGNFAFLVKNSVIKNVVQDQATRKYRIGKLEKQTIDSKIEFNVSVEAALFYCKLNTEPEFTCQEYNFYTQTAKTQFGWVNDKFVSNIETYKYSKDIDGVCPFEWRQGIKHDLSAVMELERQNGHFINGRQEEINLEEDLIFGILKSSDLKNKVVSQSRKHTIITQKRVGQDTSFIQHQFPKTFDYLHQNKNYFEQRKSSIYNNKPNFSIFGIGDYSFAPYKVAISGLYKTFSFSLVLPLQGKPLMLDDTCYLLGFDNLHFAAYTNILLNTEKAEAFLQTITFSDAKRFFTKDILKRIDLYKLALEISKADLKTDIDLFNQKYNLAISLASWSEYLNILIPKTTNKQMDIAFNS